MCCGHLHCDEVTASACPSVMVMGSTRPQWPCLMLCVCCYVNRQITELYNESVATIRDSNKWDMVRPAFTCDLWRSRTRREYFTLTMHYIDVRRGDSGTQWLLQRRILGSVPVQATNIDHEGDQQCLWPVVCAGHSMVWAFFVCGCFTVACNVAFPARSPYVCHMAVVVGLARQELHKYNLVG